MKHSICSSPLFSHCVHSSVTWTVSVASKTDLGEFSEPLLVYFIIKEMLFFYANHLCLLSTFYHWNMKDIFCQLLHEICFSVLICSPSFLSHTHMTKLAIYMCNIYINKTHLSCIYIRYWHILLQWILCDGIFMNECTKVHSDLWFLDQMPECSRFMKTSIWIKMAKYSEELRC